MIKRAALIALVVAVGCGKKESADKSAEPATGAETPAAAETVAREPVAVDGPAVAPVVTKNITFVTPKPGVTWAEMAFPCYRAAIEMEAGASVAAPFYQASPLIEPALKAANIDLERGDVAALGGWDCGGEACMYFAANLREPGKIGDLVAMIAPEASQPEPLHWSFGAPGANGARTIHIRVVPIQWGDTVPNDPWSSAMAKATHVIFLTGVMGGADVDPLASLATGDAAARRVADAEGVLADTRGRCVLGTSGPSEFKPGFDLESSRFAMGVPPAKTDHLAQLMGSNKSLDVEIELALSAAATDKDVQRWIEQAREWVSGIAAPLRMQFAAQGEMVEVIFEAAALMATQGFRHELDGKLLRLSWRTDRVERADLDRFEADLQRVMGGGL